ncbi:hypothetical protein FE249_18730 (plasmid) [Acidiphilium multivorum]|uniref:hypothetical protein n=1 Tax=Acidiphilium multivorum TaxID=62140 RepID=UPI001F4C13FD|nr:hypothetical protein [Acidiphilium multivorum]UNC16253.1 hypothetical protein FE249_18730 [Acidiphilium multivorum]
MTMYGIDISRDRQQQRFEVDSVEEILILARAAVQDQDRSALETVESLCLDAVPRLDPTRTTVIAGASFVIELSLLATAPVAAASHAPA